MPDLSKYPHVSRFDDIPIAYASSLTEKQFSEAKASLDNLKNLLPEWQVNLDKNVDLLGISFNAAVVNYANKNGDVMDTATAIKMYETFRQKHLNREHKREKIIGHIINAQFSSYGESNLLYPMDIQETQDPFNISLGAVVYKVVDGDYAKQIEESANEDSPKYNSLSASWEIGMANYRIAMGSPNLKECQIIDNPKHVADLKQYLRAYGGDGTYNNALVYRLIGEECLAIGCAITSRPAANVKGLLTRKKEPETSRASFFNNFFDKNQKPSVTPNKHPHDMEKLEQILEEIKAHMIKDNTTKGFEAAIADKIREASESYTAKVNEAKASQEKAEKEAAEIKASQETIAKQLAETQEKLAKIEAEASAKEAADVFSARMAEFDSEYDLEDEDRQILASDLKEISTDEAYAAYKDKMAKLMKNKNKKAKEKMAEEAKAALDKEIEKRLAEVAKASHKKLSDKELAEKALEEAKASEKVVPNNNGNQSQEDLKEAWAKAFSAENIKISFN
jgi:hypothetical protein